nr:BppU family phage baseplate upper protein [Oscillospiraceae bacterium]
MIITHKLEMDLVNRKGMPRIDVVQGDCNARVLELTLLCDGRAWQIPEGTRVRIRYCKGDGTKGLYDTLPEGTAAWSAQGNILTLVLAPQMLTAAGPVLAQAELTKGECIAATFAVQVNVEPDPAQGVLASEDYVSMVQWMEGELEKMLAEAKASGEFNGAPGPQGAPGEAGPSAYDFAVAAGYTGTEEEFGQMLIIQCLPLTGGTMAGSLAMSGNRLTGLPYPYTTTDAVPKNYVDQKRRVYTVTLTPERWDGAGPYTQTVLISGMLASDRPHVGPVYSGDLAADIAMQAEAAKISYAKAESNELIFTCLKEKPEKDVSVQMEVLR